MGGGRLEGLVVIVLFSSSGGTVHLLVCVYFPLGL